jgi:hypothetical protein
MSQLDVSFLSQPPILMIDDAQTGEDIESITAYYTAIPV